MVGYKIYGKVRRLNLLLGFEGGVQYANF